DWEGCLSVPDLRGMVPRWTAVRVEGYDRGGQRVHFTATAFHARVVQHECDHLDGRVYLDRMHSMETLSFLPEFHRYWATRTQYGPGAPGGGRQVNGCPAGGDRAPLGPLLLSASASRRRSLGGHRRSEGVRERAPHRRRAVAIQVGVHHGVVGQATRGRL